MVKMALSSVMAALTFFALSNAADVLVEAESFGNKGGWVVDQQFMDQMGSPFLMAHGMGVPVPDALDTVTFPGSGIYHVYVRTRDWVAPYGPGRFSVSIDGVFLDTLFGAGGDGTWQWQYGGTVNITGVQAQIGLKDLTGFEGRCDAILFREARIPPPNDLAALYSFRKTLLGFPLIPPDTGMYDLVVVGGGMAGICAAVSAARLGCRVALVQDRPVLGGNNSSEIAVWLNGFVNRYPYTRIGDIVKELDSHNSTYGIDRDYVAGDQKKLNVVLAEENITLLLNAHVFEAEMEDSHIVAVYAKHIENGREWRLPARVFADCSGDGNLGFLAGAEFMMGREGRNATGESLAPLVSDSMHMGVTNSWYADSGSVPSGFPACPWAFQFNPGTYNPILQTTHSDWQWEAGFYRDQISQGERIRDGLFCAIYGNWDFLKNVKGIFQNWKLTWVAYVSGRRESRRLRGDYVLSQQDLETPPSFADGCVVPTWTMDLHYPEAWNVSQFPDDPFYSNTTVRDVSASASIPFRCLYSKNIENLFMAGRCISVTHAALGSVRVMRTGGMMGEVVGNAAYVCKLFDATPLGVYLDRLDELKTLLLTGQVQDSSDTGGVIIIDNTASQTNGDWASSTYTSGYYGVDYLTDGDADKGEKSAVFAPVRLDGGRYEVFLRWTAGANRAGNVPVLISHSQGVDTVSVDMRINNGIWIKLGGYTLDSAGANRVTIQTTGTDGYVIADAVMFVPLDTSHTTIAGEAGTGQSQYGLCLSPNPFNPLMVIRYHAPRASRVRIQAFNSSGRCVATLQNGRVESGFHTCAWCADGLPSGVYLVRMNADDFKETRKAIFLK